MKLKLMILVVSLGILTAGSVSGSSISLLAVDTLWPGDSLPQGVPVTFYLKGTNTEGLALPGLTNGFRVYSEAGATWTTTTGDTMVIGKTHFDIYYGITLVSVTGSGADTIGFGGARLGGSGLPADFDDTLWSITIGPFDSAHGGRQICLDSTYYPPTGEWFWSLSGVTTIKPDWDGPHCWPIEDPLGIAQGVRALSGDNLPTSFALNQNYPNPFNPTTQIAFDLPVSSQVELTVYNVLGQKVSTLVNEKLGAGSYEADWDGRSDGGNQVASGIYFYRLHTEAFTQTKKMILLK